MHATQTERYARCIRSSKRMHWDIDIDVIRGRCFKTAEKFLPDSLEIGRASCRERV